MKLIGKGSFTKAYLLDNGSVYLYSCCPIKEIMALGWFPDSELFPSVVVSGDGYTMKYYPKVSSLKKNLGPEQYAIYKALRGVYSDIRERFNI